ncbi:long-chain fatty acid--CoA ligase [Alicyclobacillus sp. SO9]|nr:long-chain fatty acid--CoA ligase [Alicyclobacillus sp. SO9]
MLEATVERYPTHTAAYFMGNEMSYRELYTAVAQVMSELSALGVKHGQRIALMMPNCPEYVIAYYAITGLGSVVVQISPMSTPTELKYVLGDSGAPIVIAYEPLLRTVFEVRAEIPMQTVIGVRFSASGERNRQTSPQTSSGTDSPDIWLDEWTEAQMGESADQSMGVRQTRTGSNDAQPAARPLLPDRHAIHLDDVAVLQYTGGTTGKPKGAMLTHRNLVANAVQSSRMIPGGITVQDKMVCALPFFHVYAMTVCMNLSVFTGMTMLIVPRFDAKEVMSLFEQHHPTLFPGVPTMYVALSQAAKGHSDALASLRACNSGGAPLPEQVMVHFENLTGAVVLEGYGLSEASPVTHTNPGADRRRPGSIGLPVANTEARIVDAVDGETELGPNEEGELLIKGPQVMKGYWQRPRETEQTLVDGWLHTGDIAKIDEDGYAYIVDRKKDLIIASGYNVYPREVEEVLYKHPAVVEAAVVGADDHYRGETVKAFVVVQKTHQVTEEEIMNWCRKHLSAYKVPKQIEFREDLPKSAVGKVLRRDLRTHK